jgi:hypothetical protein
MMQAVSLFSIGGRSEQLIFQLLEADCIDRLVKLGRIIHNRYPLKALRLRWETHRKKEGSPLRESLPFLCF